MPLIVEILGLPNAGKSSLMLRLEDKLKDRGVSVLCLKNTDFTVQGLKAKAAKIKKRMEIERISDVEKQRLRSDLSWLFQEILVRQDKRAQSALQEVVLFEHGLYGTEAMECWGSGFKKSTLRRHLGSVGRPDMVIYLAINPSELWARGVSPLLWKEGFIDRVYKGLESIYQSSHLLGGWVRIEGVESENLSGVAEYCADRISESLRTAKVPSRSF